MFLVFAFFFLRIYFHYYYYYFTFINFGITQADFIQLIAFHVADYTFQ